MIQGLEFLRTINKINDVLSIVPSVSRMRKALSIMTHSKKPFYAIELKGWMKNDIERSIKKLAELKMLNVNDYTADKCLVQAIKAGNKLRAKIPGMLKKKFEQDKQLGVYIKCHMDLPNSDDDGLAELMADILKDVYHLQTDERIEQEVPDDILELLGKYFDYTTELPVYADDIKITFGWFKPNPVNVEPYADLDDSNKVDREQMEAFFSKYDVIELQNVT